VVVEWALTVSARVGVEVPDKDTIDGDKDGEEDVDEEEEEEDKVHWRQRMVGVEVGV